MRKEQLYGKVILVTGGSGGIGSAICKRAAEEGAIVVIHYFSKEDKAKEVQAYIQSISGESMMIQGNLSVSGDVSKIFEAVLKKYSKIDILVNNAGRSFNALVTMTREEQWQNIMDINLKSVFLCSKKFIYQCLKRNSPGAIVNVSSVAGLKGSIGMGVYAVAKAGVHSLTKTLAKEYGNRNIRINAIAPGPIDTDMMSGVPQEMLPKIIGEIPMGRIGLPDEVANLVIFLGSEQASFINGAIIPADGGQTA